MPRKNGRPVKIESQGPLHTQDRNYDDEEHAKRDMSDRLSHDKGKETIDHRKVYRQVYRRFNDHGRTWQDAQAQQAAQVQNGIYYVHNERGGVEGQKSGPEPTNSNNVGLNVGLHRGAPSLTARHGLSTSVYLPNGTDRLDDFAIFLAE